MNSIDFTRSASYTLSIRLSADGFSFSICNPSSAGNDFYFFPYPVDVSCSMTANLKHMLAETEALKHAYHQINILYDTDRFTPVPLELFEDEQMDAFFNHNFLRENGETVLCNVLGKSSVVILFGIDKHVHQLLAKHFPEARIFSTVSPLTEYFARKSRLGGNRKLYAHVREESLEVFAYDNGKLLLANAFRCRQDADRMYYLLYIWHQLNFNQEKDELHLVCAAGGDGATLLKELRNYLRLVFVIYPKAEFHRSGASRTEGVPFDMQTLLSCE